MFLETSALTGENVEEGFLKCARTILNKIDSGTQFFFEKEAYLLFFKKKNKKDLLIVYHCIVEISHYGSL